MTQYNSYRTDEKRCTKCAKIKSIENFSGKTATYCKPCFKEYRATLRQKHKEDPTWINRDKPQSLENRKIRKEYYVNHLKNNPCIKCGEDDPIVLEFNHIDPSTKTDLVSKLAHQGTMEQLQAEIEKCEVLCANCHKRVTAKQMNWFWLGTPDEVALNSSGQNLNPYRCE